MYASSCRLLSVRDHLGHPVLLDAKTGPHSPMPMNVVLVVVLVPVIRVVVIRFSMY